MKLKTSQDISARRAEGRHAKPAQPVRQRGLDWKFWLALVVAIMGAILTGIGLQARPSVTLEPPLDPQDVFTSQFVISNDGWLNMNHVHAFAYVKEIMFDQNMVMKDLEGIDNPENTHTLDIGERQTVPWPNMFGVKRNKLLFGDVAIVVRFRPNYFPFLHRKRFFRFRIAKNSDGTYRLQQQPADTIEKDYEKAKAESHWSEEDN